MEFNSAFTGLNGRWIEPRRAKWQLTVLKICCHFVGYAKLAVLGKVQRPFLYMTSKK